MPIERKIQYNKINLTPYNQNSLNLTLRKIKQNKTRQNILKTQFKKIKNNKLDFRLNKKIHSIIFNLLKKSNNNKSKQLIQIF